MRHALCALVLASSACGSTAPNFGARAEASPVDAASVTPVADASAPAAASDAAPLPGSVVLDAGYLPFDGRDSGVPPALAIDPNSPCVSGVFCSSLGEVRAMGSTPHGPVSQVILQTGYTQWSTGSTNLTFVGLIGGTPFVLRFDFDPPLGTGDAKAPPGVYDVVGSFLWADSSASCHADLSLPVHVKIDVHTGDTLPLEGAPIDLRGTALVASHGFGLSLAFSARYSCQAQIPL